ncbi:MAG TPA: PIG-L family deacetylase [Actinomycetes bacterium]|nr:PIG-L family deacetylase [Actinomycetes bacterium]
MTGRHGLDVAEEVAQLGTVLSIWAHPGDETFMAAGLMALARAAGNRVVVVTATRGEHGTGDPARWPADRLARLRSDELAAALAVLEVTEHRWLGFGHGECASSDAERAVEHLRTVVDEIAPDTVVTFGPDGLTGDRDHRAVSAWTSLACSTVARVPRVLHARPAADRDHDPAGEPALRLRLNAGLIERKAAALRAHASQVLGLHPTAGGRPIAARWCAETFAAAKVGASAPAADRRIVAAGKSGDRDGIEPRAYSCLTDDRLA